MIRRVLVLLLLAALIPVLRTGSPGVGVAMATGLCGDGDLDAGEDCDDGNTADGDCCSSSCTYEPAGEACPDDGFACTVESCDGAGTCQHTPEDTLCDDGSVCSNDVCDAGTCVHTPANAGLTCRASAGECDPDETCDGAHTACPADDLENAGTPCTDDGEICTRDVCNGSSPTCTHPAGHGGTVCRAAVDTCDVTESCNGSSPTCPADAVRPASFLCRGAADACDAAETCNGTSPLCPVDLYRPASFPCRNATGECDLAETCTGSSATCPSNAFKPSGTTCTDDGNACTADVCNGSGACTHPAGNGGVVCRAATDVCDVAEVCTGSSPACPVNGFRPSSFICRGTTGECDVAESCTGNGPLCPSNAFAPPNSACTADANPCTADRCDGSGACTHPPGNPGVVCRTSTAACDVAEICDGVSVVCPADSGLPDSDADGVCDAQDACTNLGGGQDFKPLRSPKLTLTRINDNVIPGDDKLVAEGVFDLGVGKTFDAIDPSATGARILLLNASGGTELDVALPAGTYHGRGTRGWTPNFPRTRWKYADKTSDGLLATTYSGISSVRVEDRSKRTPREVQIKVLGKFGNYPIVSGDSPVRVVVVLGQQSAAAAGLCGESNFLAADCTFNALRTTLRCRK
jgi:cysteine-rich repeat protein